MGTYVDRPITFSLMECQIPIVEIENLLNNYYLGERTCSN